MRKRSSLYGRGMSTRDIHDQLQDLYGIEMSAEMVSRILPEIREWQSRPLNPVYPFVFMDCIHYKVREEGRILSRAAYVVLGVTTEGYKEILSITVGANESSKFWMGMLNDLKNRGVHHFKHPAPGCQGVGRRICFGSFLCGPDGGGRL